MDITIKPLTPELCGDFLRYFDGDAFSDHDEWAGCYCLESHMMPEENEALSDRADRRRKAEELIKAGVMRGYLLYDGGRVVGWCSAGDKGSFRPVREYEGFFTDDPDAVKIRLLYCVDIAPDYRGKGLIRRIIERVIADARADGCAYVECLPFSDEGYAWQYHGPKKLYEKYGFEVAKRLDWCYVMRKSLD